MNSTQSILSPQLRVLYLLLVAIGVFFVPAWQWILAFFISQFLWALALGVKLPTLLEKFKKITFFVLIIVVAYGLFPENPGTEWITLDLKLFALKLNAVGLLDGVTMALRVLTIVIVSILVRQGDPKAIAAGLAALGLPKIAALTIDATLELLSDSTRKRKGGGGGRGNGRGKNKESKTGRFKDALKKLSKGDTSILSNALTNHIKNVEQFISEKDNVSAHMARDVAIISGISLTMLGIKVLKLLPGLPFLPGHKGILLIPLYIVAGRMTQTKFGSSTTGFTMGVVAFLLGDGRWGIFEVLKHVAPGLMVDLLMPLLGRTKKIPSLMVFGALVALGRFATTTAIALVMQAPSLVFALLIPSLLVHLSFGIISGIVTAPLLRNLPNMPENTDHE